MTITSIEQPLLKPSLNSRLKRLALFVIAVQISLPATAAIYYNKKVMGPVISIQSVDLRDTPDDLTHSDRWRDMEFTVSPTGDIVFSSNREGDIPPVPARQDKYSIFLYKKSDGKIQKISSSPYQEMNPVYSPNGEMVLFLRQSGTSEELQVWKSSSGKSTTLFQAQKILGYSWFNNNNDIVIAYEDGSTSQLLRKNLETGESAVLSKEIRDSLGSSIFVGQLILAPVVSDDSKSIAFICHPKSREGVRKIISFDLEKHEAKVLTPDYMQPQEPLHWSKDNNHLLFSALLNYRFYFSEKEQRKIYQGSMHIFTVATSGELTQISRGDNQRFARPVYSPDEKKIAFMYSPELGGVRELTLEVFDSSGNNRQAIAESVSPFSQLHWH